MKYNKEMRWLAFLLVPFVVLLSLHFLIPLAFIMQSYPIVQVSIQQNNIFLGQTSTRSFTYNAQLKLIDFVNSFSNTQQTILDLLEDQQSRSIGLKTQGISLNNAYNYSEKVVEENLYLNSTQNRSMWFATGVSQISTLSAAQQAALAQYKQIEPFIGSLLFSSADNFAYSLSTYLVPNDSQPLYLEYPSRYSSRFSSLNTTVLDDYYNATVGTLEGRTVPFIDFAAVENLSLLVLCTPGATGVFEIVSCLRLNLSSVSSYLFQQQFRDGGAGAGAEFESFLLLSNDLGAASSSDPQIVLSFSSAGSGSFSAPQGEYYGAAFLGNSLFSSTPNSVNNNFFTRQSNFTTFFAAPVFISPFQEDYIPLHMLIKQIENQSTAAQTIVSDAIKQLLIPILILIALATIISICIMKSLLDSVDKELYDLDSRCKFIVDGDINIEIISHHGTKDIAQLYNQVRIINKLHRYSTQSYFAGHFSQKVLKYNEAYQFLKKLGYDTGNILENMGEAYTYTEDWDKARDVSKQSVHMILKQIEEEFGTLDEMMALKAARKVPHRYKELQVILIRRLFKLNFFYFRYLQLKQIFLKKERDQEDQKKFKEKQQEIAKQSTVYVNLLKKAFYPDYSSYSESIISLLNECKQLANLKNISQASKLLKKAQKILQKYAQQYVKTTQLLKLKGSKHKFLHIKNKLTAHSRVNPDILHTFQNMFKSKIIQAESKSAKRYIEAINVLFEGTKVGLFTAAITYLSILEIRKILQELKVDSRLFESTQIFRQSLPFITLHYGPITKEVEAQISKIPTKASTGLERQFVLVFDCGKDYLNVDGKLREYQQQRINHLYQKLIKKTDRISVIKHSTKYGVVVECGLIIKDYNSVVLKKTLDDAIAERNLTKSKQCELGEAINRSIERIKHLKLQKVVIMFFKPIDEYKEQLKKIIKRKTKYSRGKRHQTKISEDDQSILSIESHSFFGESIVSLMQQDGLRNLKLILFCSHKDSIQTFNQYFDLEEINRRIWSKSEGLNLNNNVVYVIEQKHKPDLDRILMLKTQDVADNNIFIL